MSYRAISSYSSNELHHIGSVQHPFNSYNGKVFVVLGLLALNFFRESSVRLLMVLLYHTALTESLLLHTVEEISLFSETEIAS